MAQVLDRETLDGRVVLNGTWEQFKLIQKISEDSPGIKLSFFAGAIEILMPGFQHENFSEIIGYLVTAFLLQQGMRLCWRRRLNWCRAVRRGIFGRPGAPG